MLKELQKKKLLEKLKFKEVFEDAEAMSLSKDLNPPAKYYPEIQGQVPYGAGGDKAKNSIIEGLSRTYKNADEFAKDVIESKEKKQKPDSAVDNFDEEEEREKRKKEKLLQIYNKKGVS
jgi:hypothetical protein